MARGAGGVGLSVRRGVASVGAMLRRAGRPLALALVALVLAVQMAAPRAAHASTRLAGNVWVVDEDAQVITLLDAGKKIAFVYGGDTIVRRGSADGSIKELRRGDRIVVTLEEP